MKKFHILTVMSLLFCAGTLSAQEDSNDQDTSPTSQGKFLVGGSSNLSFSSLKGKVKRDDFDDRDTGTTTIIEFAPGAAYFVADNLALGLEISFTSNKFKGEGDTFESKLSTIAAFPFARYYFAEGNIKPFVQGSVGFGSSKNKSTSDFSEDDEFKSSIFAFGADAGVAIFLSEHASIDLGLGYISTSSKAKDNNEDNQRFINSGLGFAAGFSIFF